MTVDIYLKEKSGKREIRFPLLPEEFSFPSGDAMFVSSDIMGRGEVVVPSGTELGNYSWESEFPGLLRQNDSMMRGAWQDPKTYVSILQDWKTKGTLLNLLITGYPVNVDVYIKEFTPKGAGAFGDVFYDIKFVEARTITITSTTVDASQLPNRNFYKANSYTILAGDTLWSIAEKFYNDGSQWEKIYSANKELIEAHAKDRGFSGSSNGRWIWPGTILTIP